MVEATEMTAVMAELRETMRGVRWRIEPVQTFTHGAALQVWRQRPSGKWQKISPLLFPGEEGTIADVLRMLADLAADAETPPPA